jgi:hypothetical protein
MRFGPASDGLDESGGPAAVRPGEGARSGAHRSRQVPCGLLAVSRAHHESRGDAATVAALDEGLRDGGPHEGFRRAADTLASHWRRTGTIQIAEYYALAEEWESALEWIEAAVDVRDANLPVVGTVPTFWRLHDDPRFRAVVEGLGLPLQQGQPGWADEPERDGLRLPSTFSSMWPGINIRKSPSLLCWSAR